MIRQTRPSHPTNRGAPIATGGQSRNATVPSESCAMPHCRLCGAATGRDTSRMTIGMSGTRRCDALLGTRDSQSPYGLARHAVAEVDDSRADGAGLDEFEVHPALALGKERNATANQHRVDPGPVLVDQTQLGRLGGER